MMHVVTYCDTKGCGWCKSLQIQGYDDLRDLLESYLRSEGWEVSRYKGGTYHYCSSCAKQRKEEAVGGDHRQLDQADGGDGDPAGCRSS